MSTTRKGVFGEPGSPHSSSTQPGALALLGATALGGVIGSRLRGAPLMIAAGATALALMRKKPAPPALTPAPQSQEIQPQNLIKQWLEQQTERELLAPLFPLHAEAAPEDDYTPEPLLTDSFAETNAPSLLQDHFASLTEPAHFATPAVRRVEPAAPVTSGWIPGIDPLPSWTETPDTPAAQEADPSPPEEMTPMATTPVFSGGTLPDEIEVTQPPESQPAQSLPFEPPEEMPPQALTEPETVPHSETEISPEITVHLAEPGEASFDPPLMGLSSSWSNVEVSQPASVVVEAEVILRPRAPMHNTVISKNITALPAFSPAPPVEAAPAGQESPALPRAPLQTPREQRARSTWRSWWRGD